MFDLIISNLDDYSKTQSGYPINYALYLNINDCMLSFMWNWPNQTDKIGPKSHLENHSGEDHWIGAKMKIRKLLNIYRFWELFSEFWNFINWMINILQNLFIGRSTNVRRMECQNNRNLLPPSLFYFETNFLATLRCTLRH